MKIIKRYIVVSALSVGLFAACKSETKTVEVEKNTSTVSKTKFHNEEVEKKIDVLLSKMTLEEKVGQMTQITLDVISKGAHFDSNKIQEIDDSLLYNAIVKYKVGSILNTGQSTLPAEQWQKIIARIQEETKKTPLQIPVLYGVDAIHGVNYTVGGTLFPQELATAATFQPEYARLCGEVTAYELRASSIPWNFSPVLDLGRQPLWSRFFETFGEDPYLVTQMGNAIVKGYQGEVVNSEVDKNHVAACLKHFFGYSNSKTGHDRTPIQMSERELREYYLVPFQEAIANGALSVMVNSAEINGTPMHANYHLLTEVLKDELAFEGFAVTDWEDIVFLHNTHRIAKDEKEATKLAINAGIDMSMVPMKLDFADYLVELVNEKEVSMERIDDAVRRILRVKFRTGIFETPITPLANYPKFGSEEFTNHAYEAAKESVTLLKNTKNVLPLSKNAKVLFTGVGANSINALNGAWTHTWQGQEERFNTVGKKTIFEAAKSIVGEKASYIQGTNYDAAIDIDKAVAAARKSDVIVVCLGELPATEKVGDIVDLNLPQAQKDLVKALAKTGKPIVAVLLQSRPRVISDIEPLFAAVLEGYWPGDEGGRAIAETIFGDNNPSGKLPFTYPRNSNDLVTYDHKFAETKDKNFGFNAFNPQWQFGDGLSYTTFEYSNLQVNDTVFNSEVKVTVTVTNTGTRDGKEAVLLFSEDHVASITPSVKRLRKFEKINLKAGESKEVSFVVTAKDLAFLDAKFNWITEEGKFSLMVKNLKKDIVYSKK